MKINYDDFLNKTISEKYTFLEDCVQNITELAQSNERDIKTFFKQIIQSENEIYLRKLSIEILSFLTALNKVRRISTLDILLDIKENDPPLIIVSSLKYLFSFYNYSDDDRDIVNKLLLLKDSNDGEVSSEAYYRLGLISLFENLDKSDNLLFLKQLDESKRLFKNAVSLVENRADAEYFFEVTKYLISILSGEKEDITISLEKLLSLSLVRRMYTYNDKVLHLENKIQKVLTNVYWIFQISSNHEDWLDYVDEFTKLAQYYSEYLNLSLSCGSQSELIENFKVNICSNIFDDLYIRNFSYYKAKIINIQNKFPEDKVLYEFLDIVKNKIENKEKKKDKKSSLLEITLRIKEIIPEVDAELLASKVSGLTNPNDVREILSIIKSFIERTYEQEFDVITGDSTGEEMFFEVISSINRSLPKYSPKKLSVFKRILEEMIRYLILTIKSKRTNDFNLFYAEKHGGKGSKVTEREFQDNMYKHFQYSNIAYGAEEEINNFTDGGRIDIVFKIQNYTFPIELKKTTKLITKESIREKYLEQIHSYVYAYDQLGIFVVLDLNEKTKPINGVRELIYVDHLEPQYELDNKYPDYIVVMIIPGNKLLPSEKSTYG
ncbi:hypothetical protein IM538_14795 [Cytobacillus suaedae]|nr:hypothetical protein IM538_14795 [Cytobacillus suaedae]